MPRRRRTTAEIDSHQDLARKMQILERELAVQRQAMERLKQLSAGAKPPHASLRST